MARLAGALFVVGAVAFGLAAAARGRFVGGPARGGRARERLAAGGSRAGALGAGEGVERGPSAASALRSRSASPARWSRRYWIATNRARSPVGRLGPGR